MTLLQILNKCKTILIVGHMRSDGDCIGAGLALKSALEKVGKNIDFVCDSDLPAFDFIPGYNTINNIRFTSYDAVIAEDCGDKLRMGKYRSMLNTVSVTINIDHHFSNDNFAKYNFVNADLSSTCEVLYNLLKPLKLLDKRIAECLYVGLSTDTGHFLHNTTTRNVFLMAADLMSYGIDASLIASNIYQQNTVEKTALIAKALSSIRYFLDNKVGIIVISNEMLSETSCTIVDTEGIIDYLMKVKQVKIGMCITEQKQNFYKISIRSKGANVAKVAESFGGGGHIRASGFVMNGFLQDVIDAILNTIDKCEIL